MRKILIALFVLIALGMMAGSVSAGTLPGQTTTVLGEIPAGTLTESFAVTPSSVSFGTLSTVDFVYTESIWLHYTVNQPAILVTINVIDSAGNDGKMKHTDYSNIQLINKIRGPWWISANPYWQTPDGTQEISNAGYNVLYNSMVEWDSTNGYYEIDIPEYYVLSVAAAVDDPPGEYSTELTFTCTSNAA